mgnify:CR=1 FL=1
MLDQDNDQIQQRRRHLEEIAALGNATYTNRFDRSHNISQLVEKYSSQAGKKEGDELDGKVELFNISKDFFGIKNSPQKFQFIRDKKGKIISIEVFNFPVQYGPYEINIKTDKPVPTN